MFSSVIYSLMIAVKTLCLSIMAVLTLVDKEISYLFILPGMSVATANGKRKHRALQYWLPLAGAKIRVCKKCFLAQLMFLKSW